MDPNDHLELPAQPLIFWVYQPEKGLSFDFLSKQEVELCYL